ncbi:HAMP domain-containing histidine kinase [candidate division WOR-3 bacterium]|nr:HAMP domain-containing histidine kinase [candidate division WOR-3 bacterium]
MIQYAVVSEDGKILSVDKNFSKKFSLVLGQEIDTSFPFYEHLKDFFSFNEFVHEEKYDDEEGAFDIFPTVHSSKRAALILFNREKLFQITAETENRKKNAVYNLLRFWKKIVEEDATKAKLEKAVEAVSSMGWERIFFCYTWKNDNFYSSRGYTDKEMDDILKCLPFDLPIQFEKNMTELSKIEGIYYIVPGHRKFEEILSRRKTKNWKPGYLVIIPMKRSKQSYAGWLMFDDPMEEDNPVKEDIFNLVGFFQSVIAELDVLQTAEELLKSQKERETILYEIAHDLKNPLSVIRVYAETLIGEDFQREKMEYFSRVIIDKSKYILSMVEDMLELSKLQNIENLLVLKEVDLKELIRKSLLSQSDFAYPKNIEFDIKFPKEVTQTEGDAQLLQRAVENIINNAVKFSQEDSVISVSLSEEGDSWKITVEDHGMGIEDEDKEKIFKKFYRSVGAKNFQGTGLGLSIVDRIIQLHGGEISLESYPGKSTVFYLKLKKRVDE